MRAAIISDIHGNAPALDAVLADIEAQAGIDRLFCLGDLVGYAPFPNEVIQRIQGANIPTLMGNYDDGAGFDRDDCGCAYTTPEEKRLGDKSLDWTKAEVTSEHKAFLRSLLPEIRLAVDETRILLVHGSPRRINEYLYADRPAGSFRRIAAAAEADVIVFGHTHLPYTKLVHGVLFVNAGSVGKPKDGDWRAGYILLDVEAGTTTIRFRRVDYDVGRVATAIRASALPSEYAAMLERGRS